MEQLEHASNADLLSKLTGKPVAFLLSVCLGLFLADAAFSLLDDSLILLLGVHFLIGVHASFRQEVASCPAEYSTQCRGGGRFQAQAEFSPCLPSGVEVSWLGNR